MAEYVRDTFTRTVAGNWGTADVGGAWTQDVSNATASVHSNDWARFVLGGSAAARGDQRAAAATAARDVAGALIFQVNSGYVVDVGVTLWLRVASGSTVALPTGYYARVTAKADFTFVLSLGYAVAGAETQLASVAIPGPWVANQLWRLEAWAKGAPTVLQARLYRPAAAIPPGGNGWLKVSDEVGPQVAGLYQVRASKPTSAAIAFDMSDVYVSDVPVPAFTATPTGLSVAFSAASSTGDFTAYAWSWGDGTAAGSGATPTHVYAAAGTYLVTLTGTTRWGATFTGQSFVEVSAPPPPTPPLRPIVRIGTVDVCDDLVSVSWIAGQRLWTDQLTGQTASIELRGRYGALQGQPVTITAPTSPTATLWVGIVDQVTENISLTEPGWTTSVTAMDNTSWLGRAHLEWSTILTRQRLPGRLAELRPNTRISYRPKWSGINATLAYPEIRKMADPGDEMRKASYLDKVNEALNASITIGYTARDGAIVYGHLWALEYGATIPTTSVLDLSAGIDCASHVDKDRANVDGIVNRWTYGDGNPVDGLEFNRGASIDAYGEHAYTTPAGILVDFNRWPLSLTGIEGGAAPGMDSPPATLQAEIPVTLDTQRAIKVEPLDLARFEGTLYTVMGVRHDADYRGTWRTTLTLDRNPWAVNGANPP